VCLIDSDTGNTVNLGNFYTETDKPLVITDCNLKNYVIEMTATKTSVNEPNNFIGAPSFRIIFGKWDDKNYYTWELGGWANGDSIINRCTRGASSALHQTLFSVKIGCPYELKLVISRGRITTYVNNRLLNNILDSQNNM
jgi:hypothetical protein